MNEATRLANVLGAAAVGIGDLLAEVTGAVTERGGATAAAVLTVGTRPGRPIDELRRVLGLTHSGTVRLVDRLEARGWIRRAPTEGREVHLELTARGREIQGELLAARRRVLQELLDPLDGEERRALASALDRILRRLPSDRDVAQRICRLCEHAVCRGASCPVGSAVVDSSGGGA